MSDANDEPGVQVLSALVDGHVQRLRQTPVFARGGLCPACVARRCTDWVVQGWQSAQALPCSCSRAAVVPTLPSAECREVWLVQLWHALDDAGFPAERRAAFWNQAERLSVSMLPPRARHPHLTRYPYDMVRSWFAAGARRRADAADTHGWVHVVPQGRP